MARREAPAGRPAGPPGALPAGLSPRLLLTGFEPFDGEAVNPSWAVARALHGAQIGAGRVLALQLPCVFATALPAQPGVVGGFIHLPPLPEQAARHPLARPMALADQVQALRLVIEAVVAGAAELHTAAGRVD
jgi:pyrrolidone-carboxylate peptidase